MNLLWYALLVDAAAPGTSFQPRVLPCQFYDWSYEFEERSANEFLSPLLA